MNRHLLQRLLRTLVGVSYLFQGVFSPTPVAASGTRHSFSNFPCDGQLLNFEGINQGWIVDNYFSAYTRLNASPMFAQTAPNGGTAVGLDLNLNGVNTAGQVSIDIKNNRPGCAGNASADTSLRESESIVSVWVWVPAGVRGDTKNANGLHLYAEDANGKQLYGTWQSFQENTWFEVKMRLTGEMPPCGSMDPDFDVTRVRKIGVNVSLNIKDGKVFPIKDTIMLSPIRVEIGNLIPSDSSHLYTFDKLDTTLPKWKIVTDKVWKAEAFTGFDVHDGVLAIDADFQAGYDEDPLRKGVMDFVLAPDLDLDISSTSQDFISLDVKFDPPPDLSKPHDCPFTLQLWAFDSGKKVQFNSINQDIGSGDWTRVAFRLGDLTPSPDKGNPEDRR